MITLNNCGLRDDDIESYLAIAKEHTKLVYVDFSGNFLSNKIFGVIGDFIREYNRLEYIGLGNNNLTSLVNHLIIAA